MGSSSQPLSLEQFVTERLVVRRVRPEDFPLLLGMHQDAVTMATLGGVRSEVQTRQYLARFLEHWERNGFGMWLLYEHGDEFVGRAALRRMELDSRLEVEIGCALLAPQWGKGFATEIVTALVPLGFEWLSLPDVVAFTLPDNRASLRIVEKLGFHYEKNIQYASRRHVLYRLTRDDFKAKMVGTWGLEFQTST